MIDADHVKGEACRGFAALGEPRMRPSSTGHPVVVRVPVMGSGVTGGGSPAATIIRRWAAR
jgi:hypothetical protein